MWDGRVKTTFTIEEAMEQVKRSDNMVYTVGPMLEADWGKKKANELYKEMTLDCLRVRTRDVVYQIRDDFVDTMFLPFSTWWQDNGARRSQTGWNLGRFREYNHSVSSMYMHFSVMALAVLLIMQCARTVILRKNLFKNTGMLALAAFVQAVLAVMTTGNAVDYGKVLLLLSLWGVWGLPKQVQKQVFGNL